MLPTSRFRVLWLCAVALVLAVLFVGVSASHAGGSTTELQVLDLINQQRAAQGLAPFAWQDNLGTAAHAHSQDMATNNFCGHTGSDGSDPGTRIARAGYRATTWGETIACGQSTPQQAVSAWMNSSGHRAILMGNFQHAGVGYATGGSYGYYWTVDVGSGSGTAPASTATPRPAATATRTPVRTSTPPPIRTATPVPSTTTVTTGPATDAEAQALYRVFSRRFGGREAVINSPNPSGTWTRAVRVDAGADRSALTSYVGFLRFNVASAGALPASVTWSGNYSVNIYTPSTYGSDGWSAALYRRYQYNQAAGRVKLSTYSAGQYVHVTGLTYSEAYSLRNMATWFGFTANVYGTP